MLITKIEHRGRMRYIEATGVCQISRIKIMILSMLSDLQTPGIEPIVHQTLVIPCPYFIDTSFNNKNK